MHEKSINKMLTHSSSSLSSTMAKSPTLLLCMLAFFTLSSSLYVAQAAKSDFFYLTLTWPGSSCSDGFFKTCCMPTTVEPALDFYVESMETYDSYTGKMVTNCNTTCKFFVNQLSKFIDDMYAYWPDVSCPSNNGANMWKSTFCKYGPCSNLTQPQYFQSALTLRQDLDLLVLLGTKGIVPSKSVTYDLEDIEAALRTKYPFSFVVDCTKQGILFPTYTLSKIRYCVSMDGKRFITCPITRETTCGEKVKFPPFTYDMLSAGLTKENEMQNPIEMPVKGDNPI